MAPEKKNFVVTRADVDRMVGINKMAIEVSEVTRYNQMIASDAIMTLTDYRFAGYAWEAFSDGMTRFPQTIPLGSELLSDHPEVMQKVTDAGLDGFVEWFKGVLENDTKLEEVKQLAIERNVYHFAEYAIRMANKIPAEAIDIMRSEFMNPHYQDNTLWLSRFFNGLQTCVMEVYIADAFS